MISRTGAPRRADAEAGEPAVGTAKEVSPDAGADTAQDDDIDDSADPDGEPDASAEDSSTRAGSRLPKVKIGLTAVVAALLVVLVAAGSWLFITRPTGRSPIELTAFDEILSAARSGVVDVTSFDYLTLDQDLAEIDEVTTGDLRDEVFGTLDDRREQLVTEQQVSSTEVIAASLTEANQNQATALVVLRARQTSLLTPQETVTRYRVEVSLQLIDGRWLLSGLTGR